MTEHYLTVDFRRPDDETIEVWVISPVEPDRHISTHTYDGIGWSGLAAVVDTASAVAVTLGARVRGGTVSNELLATGSEEGAEIRPLPSDDQPWTVAKVSGLNARRTVAGDVVDQVDLDSLELSGPPETVSSALSMILRGE